MTNAKPGFPPRKLVNGRQAINYGASVVGEWVLYVSHQEHAALLSAAEAAHEARLEEAEATAENWRENSMGWEKRARVLEAALEKIAAWKEFADDLMRQSREMKDCELKHYRAGAAGAYREAADVASAALKGAPGQGAGEKNEV